jgi:hypothetical protein
MSMRNHKIRAALCAVIGVLAVSAQAQAPIGQWDFENGNLVGTVPGDMSYLDGAGGVTEQGTSFGTTTSFSIPDINGTVAKVMKFPAAADLSQGYAIPVNGAASDGGSLLNSYTLVMDLLFPAESDLKWRGLLDADAGAVEADAEFFINDANGIGIAGNYSGNVTPNVWHRVGIVVDGAANQIRKYLDGTLVGSQAAGGVDSRFALSAGGTAALFTDNDGETATGFVNSIQLRDRALTTSEMAALGGPNATGIPQTIPAAPSFVDSQSPAPGTTDASPFPLVKEVINQGGTTIDPTSVKLAIDGSDTAAVATKNGSLITISQQLSTALEPKTAHTVSVRYIDSVAGAKTNTWTFTVADFKTITLPAPIVLENFDATELGSLPAGWSVTNNTSSLNAELNLNDLSSDSYLDWVVIDAQTVTNAFTATDGTVDQEAVNNRMYTPVVIVNGQLLPSLLSGHFAYAESDQRSGSQVQVLFSPDFNLTGKTNVYLSFHSMHTQNQDDVESVEYSIDQGATWQPVVYMIDTPDVFKDTQGAVDGYLTLSTIHGDAAYGTSYGDYIGVESNRWSQLGPFISSRLDDNQIESKRVELFRLPQADNQAKVRLRFMQAGTGSWFFAIDDVGLYSIEVALAPSITKAPGSTIISVGGSATLKVEAEGTGLQYQWRLNGNPIPGATASTYTINNASTANEGDYTVVVKNTGGTVTSSPAEVKVFSGSIDQDLVVHLKFDDDLEDSTTHNNDGTAVGGPSFAPGKIGTAAHIPSGSDYVTLGTPADLNFGTDTDFSISFWAQVQGFGGDPSFIGNKDWNSGGNPGYVLATDDDGHLQWNLAGAPGSRKDFDGTPGTFSNPDWHHVVVTFDRSGNASTFVDSIQVDSRSMTANGGNNLNTTAGKATNIGQDGTGTYGSAFTDLNFDDLGIWRRVLTPQEITSIYNHGLQGEDLSKATVGGGGGGPGNVSVSRNGSQLTLSWTGDATTTLQHTTSLSPINWQDVAGTTGASSATVQTTGTAGFYRLIKR